MDSRAHPTLQKPKTKNIKLTQNNNQGTLQSKKPTMALERPLQSGTGTLDKARGGSGKLCNSWSYLAFHLVLGMKTLYTHSILFAESAYK